MKISPSILACKLTRLGEILNQLDPKLANLLHLDIMDGNFVPQLSFGEKLIEDIQKECSIPLDVHLMVNHPSKEAPKYYSLSPHNITFHYEAEMFPIRLAQEIRKNNILAGISLNPSTPVSVLVDIISYFDLVLVMSVEPGYYGQKFIETSMKKIKDLMEIKEKYNPNVLIEVDGGINAKNISSMKKLGVDIIAAGGSVFNSKSPNENLTLLHNST